MLDTAKNEALCRALGVEPKRAICMCDGQECRVGCREGKPIYPNLTSADVLMAALDRVRLRYRVSHASSIIWALDCDTHPIKLPPNFPVMLPESTGNWSGISAMHGESGGSMLFRAACAAFGIEQEDSHVG